MKKIILCFLFMVCAFSSSIKGVFAESMSNVEPLDNESGLIEQSVMGYKALAKENGFINIRLILSAFIRIVLLVNGELYRQRVQ